MISTEKKTLKTSITGVGEIEINILQCGKDWWLKEIEDFVTKSNENFYCISCLKPELKLPIHFQRALQAFVTHIQAGGEEQRSSLIKSHFRNWVNKQNGSLSKIISDNGEPKQSLREGVQSEFNKRYGSRQ